jgi:hypothetical protein
MNRTLASFLSVFGVLLTVQALLRFDHTKVDKGNMAQFVIGLGLALILMPLTPRRGRLSMLALILLLASVLGLVIAGTDQLRDSFAWSQGERTRSVQYDVIRSIVYLALAGVALYFRRNGTQRKST